MYPKFLKNILPVSFTKLLNQVVNSELNTYNRFTIYAFDLQPSKMAEKDVKVIQSLYKKIMQSDAIPHLVLLNYRMATTKHKLSSADI